jgi:hypothetical protein
LAPRSRPLVQAALDNFQRIIQPKKMDGITTATIDTFIAKRRMEKGKKPGSDTSPATINKELRHLKAALRRAKKWKFLSEVPEIIFVKEPLKLPSVKKTRTTKKDDVSPRTCIPRCFSGTAMPIAQPTGHSSCKEGPSLIEAQQTGEEAMDQADDGVSKLNVFSASFVPNS